MPTTTDLDVVRIPCNGSPPRLINIPLIEIGPGGIDKNECNDFERELEHVPNIKSLDHAVFSWSHRHLLGVPEAHSQLKEPQKANYMMYLCLDEQSGLPHNRFLDDFVAFGRDGRMFKEPIKIYGDAFVFRAKLQLSYGSDVSKRARYIQMDANFVESIDNQTTAWVILRKLLMCPQKGDWRHAQSTAGR